MAGFDVVVGVVAVVADSEQVSGRSSVDGGRVTVARTRAPERRRTTRWKDQHAEYGNKVPGLSPLGNSITASWRRSNSNLRQHNQCIIRLDIQTTVILSM